MIAEPMIALEIPPPASPKSAVGVVRKCRLSAPIPLARTEPTTIKRTMTASRAARTVEATSIARLTRRYARDRRLTADREAARGRARRSTAPLPRSASPSVSFSLPRSTISRAITLTITAKTRGSGRGRQAMLFAAWGGPLELGRDLRRQRAAGVKERDVDPGGAADHLGDRDRLADRPARGRG